VPRKKGKEGRGFGGSQSIKVPSKEGSKGHPTHCGGHCMHDRRKERKQGKNKLWKEGKCHGVNQRAKKGRKVSHCGVKGRKEGRKERKGGVLGEGTKKERKEREGF
jgi:hypothetical protein